jgi:hypothetical protein
MLRPYPDIPVVLPLSLWANISRAATEGLSSLSRGNVSTARKKYTRRLQRILPPNTFLFFLDIQALPHSNMLDLHLPASGTFSRQQAH